MRLRNRLLKLIFTNRSLSLKLFTWKTPVQKSVIKLAHLAGNRMKNNEISGSRNFGLSFNQNYRIVDFNGLRSCFNKCYAWFGRWIIESGKFETENTNLKSIYKAKNHIDWINQTNICMRNFWKNLGQSCGVICPKLD